MRKAQQLFKLGVSVQTYQELQERRKERLNLWLDRGIKVIAEKEMALIAEGEDILIELKKLYKI